MTHLFGCDVHNSPLDDLLNQYYLWESELTSQFSDMTNHVLSSITNKNNLPPHSHIIANMSIKQGGLGLQHPRTNAISSYMSTTKRCLQYAHQGVWLGFNKSRPILPDSIHILYLDWETSNDRTWTIFRKYMHDFTSICCTQAHSHLDYVFNFNTSINKSRETIKEHAAIKMRKEVLEDENITPFEIRKVLPGILDRRTSMALMTMSRLEERQRVKNNIFTIALKRKLRIKIFDNEHHHVCKCTKPIDDYGDHFLGCPICHKTTASNGIRDGIASVSMSPALESWREKGNRGGTNVITKRTLTPDEVIGEILDANYSSFPLPLDRMVK
eukprot:scaffold288090_cov76-Cyclotella_meneghiniana.AAC.3